MGAAQMAGAAGAAGPGAAALAGAARGAGLPGGVPGVGGAGGGLGGGVPGLGAGVPGAGGLGAGVMAAGGALDLPEGWEPGDPILPGDPRHPGDGTGPILPGDPRYGDLVGWQPGDGAGPGWDQGSSLPPMTAPNLPRDPGVTAPPGTTSGSRWPDGTTPGSRWPDSTTSGTPWPQGTTPRRPGVDAPSQSGVGTPRQPGIQAPVPSGVDHAPRPGVESPRLTSGEVPSPTFSGISPGAMPTMPTPSVPSGPAPSGPMPSGSPSGSPGASPSTSGTGDGAGPDVGSHDGYRVDADALREMAKRWIETSDQVSALARSMVPPARLGFVEQTAVALADISDKVGGWSTGGGQEFSGIAGSLRTVADQYEQQELFGVRTSDAIGRDA